MGDNCSCKELEGRIYWTHFQTVHFFLMLSGHDQVAIPEKFVKHFREKLGKLVYLKIPSGAKWNVGLVVDRGSLCFKLGWREFIEENSLQKGDILIFKYSGSMEFDVLLFDRQNLCEKEASYFVTNCGHDNNPKKEGKGKDKETAKQTSERRRREYPPESSDDSLAHYDESFQVGSESSGDCTGWTPSKKTRKEGIVTPHSGGRRMVRGVVQEEDIETHPGQPLGASKKIQDEHNNSTQVVVMTQIPSRPLEYISTRRPISEEEKHNVQLMADKEKSESDVVVIMKEFQVYRDFFLTIPPGWVQQHLPPTNADVLLQVGIKSWKMRFMKRTTGGMLRTGWKKFALDNCLEEYDACLFKLVDGESNPIVINVKIFRVVDEVVLPAKVRRASPRPRGKKLLVKPRRRWG